MNRNPTCIGSTSNEYKLVRTQLIEQIYKACKAYSFGITTFAIAVRIMDDFESVYVGYKDYTYISCVSFWIATKYTDCSDVLMVRDVAQVWGLIPCVPSIEKVIIENILNTETRILKNLDWDPIKATVCDYIDSELLGDVRVIRWVYKTTIDYNSLRIYNPMELVIRTMGGF